MKKLLLVLFVFSFSLCEGQSWVWGKNGIGDAMINSVATDNMGNCLAAGFFNEDTVRFGSYSLINPNAGGDFFLVKMDQNGNVLWAKQTFTQASYINGTEGNYGIATDRANNIYYIANFWDTVIVGPDTLINRKRADKRWTNYLAKYDPNGNVKWAKLAILKNDTSEITGTGVSTDRNTNCYVTGVFYDTVILGGYILNSQAYNDNVNYSFIVKYDSNGNVLWAKQSTGNPIVGGALPIGISTDQQGNSFITGNFGDTAIFGTDTLTAPNQYIGGWAFITKYDSNGNALWARNAIGIKSGQSTGSCIATDLSGNAYITGYFFDTVVFGIDTLIGPSAISNQQSIFLIKYDPNGNVLWVKQTEVLDNNNWHANGISTDNYNHIYLSGGGGVGNCKIKFGDTTLQIIDTSKYDEAAFILKLDSNGNVLCAEIIQGGGSGDEEENNLTSDSSGNYVYLGSVATTPLIFGKDTVNPYSIPVSPNYGVNIFPFVARWEECDKTLEVNNIVGNNNPEVKIFPNPSSGAFTLSLSNITGKSASGRTSCNVEIYNMMGERIKSEELRAKSEEIDLSSQPNGIYLYRVISEGTPMGKEDGSLVGSGKIIIQK